MVALFVVVLVVGAAAASPFLRTGLHEWRIARVQALAAALRGGAVQRAAARGVLDGVEVQLAIRSPRHGGQATIARAGGAVAVVTMSLRPRRAGDADALDVIAIGAPGDAAFDRAYRVVGAPAADVRALFDDELRALVRAVRLAWIKVGPEGVRVERPGFAPGAHVQLDAPEADLDGDLAVARLAVAVARRLVTAAVPAGAAAPGVVVGAVYRAEPAAAAPAYALVEPATPDLQPAQVRRDEDLGRHKLLLSPGITAWIAVLAAFTWWAGVWS